MKGIVAMVILIVAFGVAVVVVTRPHADNRGLSAAELRWVHRYGGWWSSQLATFDDALAATTRAVTLAQIQRPFGALLRCGPAYDRSPGPAPGSLSRVQSLSREACRRAAGAVAELRRNPVVPDPRRTRAVIAAEESLVGADRELTAHLVLMRSLPKKDSPTSGSRIDARYSAAATKVTDYELEVRCWSPKDWAAIRREVGALGAETAKRFFAEAGVFQGVVDLSPATCASLDRLAYDRDSGGGATLVTALATLGRDGEVSSRDRTGVVAACDGIQDVRGLSGELGASRADAARLADEALRLYRAGKLGPRTPECRNGGALDKNGSDVWP